MLVISTMSQTVSTPNPSADNPAQDVAAASPSNTTSDHQPDTDSAPSNPSRRLSRGTQRIASLYLVPEGVFLVSFLMLLRNGFTHFDHQEGEDLPTQTRKISHKSLAQLADYGLCITRTPNGARLSFDPEWSEREMLDWVQSLFPDVVRYIQGSLAVRALFDIDPIYPLDRHYTSFDLVPKSQAWDGQYNRGNLPDGRRQTGSLYVCESYH
jgi:hypothetical protein